MPNKELKVRVNLDVSNAEKSLKKLEDRITRIDRLVNKQSSATTGLTRGLDNAAKSANKLNQNIKKSGNSVGFLTKKVKALAATYLGVMGARAVINTSDVITSTENRLNNMSGGNAGLTQSTLDKTYAASQRSRGDYATMLNNVGKTMTLAGDAFQNNVDNAVRFQEIMSKAYTVGGASVAEQASSMYQLVQALGSGTLQGDELRSVREGAAYAYKEIEKFAQGVYKTDKSLKDLASDGLITSNIVVAAIMDAEERINKAFENTEMTFAQAGNRIKNTAIKSFEPVFQMLNDALNSKAGIAVLNGISIGIQIVAGGISTLFSWIEKIYNFVSDNWPIISKIILSIATIIGVFLLPKLISQVIYLMWAAWYYSYTAGVAVAGALKTAGAWLVANWALALLLIVLAAIVIAIIWVADSFADACGIIVGLVFAVQAVIYNVIAFIVNIATGMCNALVLIADNIGIAFYNTWQSAKASFWEWVGECLDGTSMIAKAVSKIASLFGLDEVAIDAKVDKAKSKLKEYHSTEDILAGFTAIEYKDPMESYQKGYEYGSQAGEWLNEKLNSFKNKFGDKLPDPYDEDKYGLGGGYDPAGANDDIANGLKKLGNIDDNTGKAADALDLTSEDLEYLRRIADMEWKKEFTTANITVDMSNYNTINGDSDLDGIVTKLSDKLREEMNVLADGVYAY